MTYWPPGMLVKPIVAWPGEPTPAGARTWAPFRSGLRQTNETLERELRMIYATSRVLQVDIDERDFRIDGFPRANARQNGPGVIVTFDVPKIGSLSYPCDTYTSWEDNLRAVALALEALRKVDRYGVTKRGEQYAGFKAIGSGLAMPSEMSREQAAEYLRSVSGLSVIGPESLRVAQRKAHPDTGGTGERFDKVMRAGRVLGLTK